MTVVVEAAGEDEVAQQAPLGAQGQPVPHQDQGEEKSQQENAEPGPPSLSCLSWFN